MVFESELALAFRDGFPVSPGHTLVIPRRHVASFFETTPDEQAAMLKLLNLAGSTSTTCTVPPPITSGSTTATPPGRPSRTCTST